MNLCDYYVEEVLSPAIYKTFEGISWWQIEVSYYYDNDELKRCLITTPDVDEISEVKKGYKFQR